MQHTKMVRIEGTKRITSKILKKGKNVVLQMKRTMKMFQCIVCGSLVGNFWDLVKHEYFELYMPSRDQSSPKCPSYLVVHMKKPEDGLIPDSIHQDNVY